MPEKSADNIVKSLTNHSDTILFSAALPYQGGQNHINEQYFQYWVAKFNKLGYEFNSDLREEIWDNEKVDWWYRQNIFIVKKKSDSPINQSKKINSSYHPVYIEAKNEQLKYADFVQEGGLGIITSFNIFLRSIKRKLFK